VSIGYKTRNPINITNCVVIGVLAEANHLSSIVIGRDAVSTAANRCTIGTIAGLYDVELQIAKGIIVGGGTTAVVGAMEWDGSNFRGHDGSGWRNLDSNPGGSDTQMQYNNAGVFGGTVGVTWDGTTLEVGSGQTLSSPGTGANSQKFGVGALAAAAGSIAVGDGAVVDAASTNGIAIGKGASLLVEANDGCVAIGTNAICRENSCTAVGYEAEAGTAGGEDRATAIGWSAGATKDLSVAIGSASGAVGTSSTAVGAFASCANANGVAVGRSAQAIGIGGVVAGFAASAFATGTISIGQQAIVDYNKTNTIAIGKLSSGDHVDAVAIGYTAATTADNRCTIGTIGGSYDKELQLGKGIIVGGGTTVTTGAMEWDGSNFRGYTGSAWVALDTQGQAPGGSTTQIQYNNAGVFGGTAGVTWDGTTLEVGSGKELSSPGTGIGSQKFGDGALSAGADSIALGDAAASPAAGSVALGNTATVGGSAAIDAIAIGRDATVANASEDGGIAIGADSTADADGCTAVGTTADAGGVSATRATALGYFARATGALSTAVGNGAHASGSSATAVGLTASATSNSGTALGRSASAGVESVAVGYFAAAAGANAVSVGESASASHAGSIAFGTNAASTAASRCTIGTISASDDMELQVGLGLGVWGVAPPASQPSKINDPSGGTTIDSEARTAIEAIIDVLEGAGLSST
jgi:hypothetical protein